MATAKKKPKATRRPAAKRKKWVKPPSLDADARALKQIRKICFALPEVVEKEAWGAPTFRVEEGKMFAMFVDNHHHDGRVALWLLAPAGAQAMLVSADAENYFVPPYVGCYDWVGVRLDGGLDWQTVAELVEEGYRLAAPDPTAALRKRKKTKSPKKRR